MPKLTLSIQNSSGEILESQCGEDFVNFVYKGTYEEGDKIVFSVSVPGYYVIQLDDVMNPSFVYMKGNETFLVIPFGEKRVSYNPKTFTGDLHLLKARVAEDDEIKVRKNLALNEYDSHDNMTCFPHAYANVETRGESVFAARNAINGNTETHSHGEWPYESWGINQNPDAELTLDFGRDVTLDTVVLVTRADFPHDNWWKQATITFSDGTEEIFDMEKSDLPHTFEIAPRTVSWLRLSKLIKDENNPSPFPALTQIEVYGTEAK